MNTSNPLERAEALLSRWMDGAARPQPYRLDLEIASGELLDAVGALVEARWGYLAAISGVDPGTETGVLWALYHFAEGAAVVTLRVILPRQTSAVPTIRELIPLAGIYEQELSEVLGISIMGAAPRGRLFLADDWPEGVYPLRKEFQPAS